MPRHVFDSHSLLKLFQKETGYKKVLSLLESIHNKKEDKYINIINFAEIIYITKKRIGQEAKIKVIASVHDMGFDIVPATDEMVYKAAEIKGAYPMSFGDCFAAATALEKNAVLVTGDPEFRAVEKMIEIYWCA